MKVVLFTSDAGCCSRQCLLLQTLHTLEYTLYLQPDIQSATRVSLKTQLSDLIKGIMHIMNDNKRLSRSLLFLVQ